MSLGSCGPPPPDKGSLDVALEGYSVRVRLPGLSRLAAKRAVAVPLTLGGTVPSDELYEWVTSLPGSSGPLISSPRERRAVKAKGVSVGPLSLGRQFIKGHVVREPLGVLPREEVWRGGSGQLSFLERFWKPVHMRVGFFPRRDTAPKAQPTVDHPLQLVNWHQADAGAAVASLSKALQVKVDPAIRKVAEAPAGARLRQRARWVLGLNPDKQRLWLGTLLSGRWTPDLTAEFAHPAASGLVAARRGGVKFLGGGTVQIPVGEGETKELAYVNAVVGTTCFRLFPELLARLSAYATLRARDAALVGALRVRALDWCKKVGLSYEWVADTVGPSVALAYLPSEQEKVAESLLADIPTRAPLESAGWWTTKL